MLSRKKLVRNVVAPVVASCTLVGSAKVASAINPTLNFQLNGTTLHVSGQGIIGQEDVQNALNGDQLASITFIVLEDGINELQSYAFNGCFNLENIRFPKNAVIRPNGFGDGFEWLKLVTNWYFINQGTIEYKYVNSHNC